MRIDFIDLKKACPKANHPLPKIDRLVDSTGGHTLLSFMDFQMLDTTKFQWLNTMRSYINQGVRCYKIISFRLKNVGVHISKQLTRSSTTSSV